jgi:glucose-fructose oxidoreductase
MLRARKRVGYAVIGIGDIAQQAILPAFAHARKSSRLVAIVSSDPAKRRLLGKLYGVDAYAPSDLRKALRRDDIDALYVSTPNTEHIEPVLTAAECGIHVLVEKPMAISSIACTRMIRACERRNVKLMVADRLHFEPANLAALKTVRGGRLGDLRFFTSEFSYQLRAGNIRQSKALGGGAIWDLGPYCINAARTFFRAEPTEVVAFEIPGRGARFREVPEGWSVLLRFPGDRTASFTCSFGAGTTGTYRLVGTKGDLKLDNAYEYLGPRRWTLTVGDRHQQKTFPQTDHFGPELVYFSDCILRDRQPEPSGHEGLADVRIIQAILRSARTGQRIRLDNPAQVRHPSPDQLIVSPATSKPPKLIHASPAQRDSG